MKFLLSSFIIFFLFIGCGYKPSSYYANDAIEGLVYVDLKVDIDNTQNSVYVKDLMNELILNQFDVSLVDDKLKADTYILVALSSVSHSSISTDSDGYVESYRATVGIKITYQKRDEEAKIINVSDYYDYTVDTDATVTDQKEKSAIKSAATKAFNSVFSRIAVNNMKD